MSDRRERAQGIAEEIRNGGNYRWVGLYDVTPEVVALIAFAGPSAPAFPVFSVDRGLTAIAINTREPVISNNVANDPRYLTALESTGSEMIVPVIDDDGVVVGTIDVESGEIGAFDECDCRRIHERIGAVRSVLFSRRVEVETQTVRLYRPVGPDELKLIEDSGFIAFPPRLPEQPIFYPVCSYKYAAEIASKWNVRDSGRGYVTAFDVNKQYLDRYEVHQAGNRGHQEYWIPAGDLPAFNDQIVGKIQVLGEFT